MRKAPRLSVPSRALAARSFTITNSQFCALLPVGALSASSIKRSTSASSTGSGFKRRIARCVRIASSSGIAKAGAVAACVGTVMSTLGGDALADALKLFGRPMTRVQNYCASGIDAFRNACLAVAAGQYDVVLAVGFEKMRDGGFARPNRSHPVLDFGERAPHVFALSANRYFATYGASKKTLAAVAVKNHKNGMKSPKAHLKMEVNEETVLRAPMIY